MEVACVAHGCGATICFSDAVYERLRRSHETWMCPFGHRQHFTDKTDEEREVEAARSNERRWRRRYEELAEETGTCPLCGWRTTASAQRRWVWMFKHFSKVHQMKIGGVSAVYVLYESRKERKKEIA